LDYCQITHEGLKPLAGAVKIVLKMGSMYMPLKDELITDETLKALAGIKEFRINGEHRITDKGIAFLKGVEKLAVKPAHKITDAGIKHLVGIKELHLNHCPGLTNEGIKLLSGIECIKLKQCPNITDISPLAGVKTFKYVGRTLKDADIMKIAGVENITLQNAPQLTDKAFLALKGAKVVIIDNCNITDEGLKAFTGAERVYLWRCNQVSNEGVEHLVKEKNTSVEAQYEIFIDNTLLMDNSWCLNVHNFYWSDNPWVYVDY
jgi:hypothetical protein